MFPNGPQNQSLKCDRCGAYLTMPVDPSVLQMECPYCKYSQLLPDIAQRRAALQSERMAKQGMEFAQTTMKRAGRATGAVLLVTMLVPVLIAGGVMFGLYNSGIFGAFGGLGGFGMGRSSWTGQGPLVCGGVEHLTVTGVVANQPGSQVVVAGGNCQLTLNNVNITGNTAIIASGNAQVTVLGGAIAGMQQSIVATQNARVNVSGASVMGPVFHSGNATVTGVPGVF